MKTQKIILLCFVTSNIISAQVSTVISRTGRTWMDKNLGASQVATATNDSKSYGNYYSSNSINNLCPKGFRLPTKKEWQNEISSWDNNIPNLKTRAFKSILKLPCAGFKNAKGVIQLKGSLGEYWSSTPNKERDGTTLYFYSNIIYPHDQSSTANSFSVRCIKNYNKESKFNEPSPPKPITSKTGRIWLDRNLGAHRIATSTDDVKAYGNYYQFGRGNDGHEKHDSPITKIQLSKNNSWHNKFIISNYNWHYSMQEHKFWSNKNNIITNPCPDSFRIPTKQEWEKEIASWDESIPNFKEKAFKSILKLPSSGYRDWSDGNIGSQGSQGYYWTNTSYITDSRYSFRLYFHSNHISSNSVDYRTQGYSIRCIKSF